MKVFAHLLRKFLFAGGLFSITASSVSAQIPDGYYESASGLASGNLKTALHTIIKGGKRLSYGSGSGGTWSGFEKTDKHPLGYVWDMYSNEKRYFPGNGQPPAGMNIEHSVAKSWWGGGKNNAYKDLYHLNPSDQKANSARGSLPLGIVKGGSTTGTIKVGKNTFGTGYSGDSFEPLDEYKGDFARAYMYMFTAYEDLTWTGTSAPTMLINERYPMLKTWAKDLLLKWHREDPVSEKELNRAAAIYQIQQNRNPFIDYPEIAEYLWGNHVGEAFFFTPSTDPVLVSPAKNASYVFPEINYTSSSAVKIKVEGRNLEESLKISLTGADAHLFRIDRNVISAQDAHSGSMLTVTFYPVQALPAHAVLMISSPEIDDRSISLSAVATENFEALPAENITQESFDAVWTPSSLTDSYYLEVYTKKIVVQENVLKIDASFASILPKGWSKTGFTEFKDGGIRMASGSSNGSVSSPGIDLAQGGTLSFVAKCWSGDEPVKIEIKIGNTFTKNVLLNNTYQEYTLEIPSIEGLTSLKFSAETGKRLFLSSVKLYSGGETIEEVPLNGFPKQVDNSSRFTVSNLLPDTHYYYEVTPLMEGAKTSEEIEVETAIANSLESLDNIGSVIIIDGKYIRVNCENRLFDADIFDVNGTRIRHIANCHSHWLTSVENGGIYLIRIVSDGKIEYEKVFVRQ